MVATKSTAKFRVQSPSNRFYFLPPLSDLCELLKIKATPYHFVKDLEAESGESSGVGKKSLYDISKDGVSQKIKGQLLKFLGKAAPKLSLNIRFSFSQIRAMYSAYRYRANAGGWLPVIWGFNNLRYSDQLDLMTEFCESRAHKELNFCKKVKKFEKEDPSPYSQAVFMTAFLAEHTLIPSPVLNEYAEAVLYNEKTGTLNAKPVIRYLLYGYADFYQSALAHYEIGTRNYFQSLGGDVDWRQKSSIQRALPDFLSKDGHKALVFNNLLEITKDLQFGEGEPGWRELSAAIPINGRTNPVEGLSGLDKKDAKAELRDKQYNVLKRWRKGKDLPSNELLAKFLAHMYDENTIEHQIIYERFKTSLAFDVWIKKWKAWLIVHLDEVDTLEMLQEVVNHYHHHYKQILQSHADIRNKAA